MTEKTPQLEPVWGPWRIASGAGVKRSWWLLRENLSKRVVSPNGLVYYYTALDPCNTSAGNLRRFASSESAQRLANSLNKS